MLIASVINQTRNTIIADSCRLALSLTARLRGLLGTKALSSTEGLLIIPCRSIHTWFMRYPIDVAFLDEQLSVIAIAEALPPFRTFAPRHRIAMMALELPAGRLRETGTKIGDALAVTLHTCHFKIGLFERLLLRS